MSKRKILKGIAYGLLGTFLSRNNDINGYWALGVLRSFAEGTGVSEVTINLLHSRSEVLVNSPVGIEEKKYQEWFRNALARLDIDVDQIKTAAICVRFTTFDEFPNVIRDTRGDPYVCSVGIEKESGKIFSVTRLGCCEAHNPKKEARSMRNA